MHKCSSSIESASGMAKLSDSSYVVRELPVRRLDGVVGARVRVAGVILLVPRAYSERLSKGVCEMRTECQRQIHVRKAVDGAAA